jgi:PIN domain nuclease of toxin-antitoxin system
VEITIKIAKGKFPAQGNLGDTLRALGFRDLPLDAESATQVARFPALEGHDPFDRMLVAQSTTHKLPLETADEKLLALGIPDIRDARA